MTKKKKKKKKILSRIADSYPKLHECLLVFKISSQLKINNNVKDLLISHNVMWLGFTSFI
jgi:transcription elongation factor Elf1